MSLRTGGGFSGSDPDPPLSRFPDTGFMTPVAALERPRATRDPRGRWIAGVSTGLSEHLGWPVALVRVGFLVLAIANGIGIILYLALWAVLPLRREDEEPRAREADLLRMLGFGAVIIALAVLAYGLGWGTFRESVAPLLVVGLGVALVWRQAGHLQAGAAGFQWFAAVVGTLLVALGIGFVIVGQVGWRQGAQAIAVLLLVIGGLALLASPWLLRVYRDLVDERSARIREQERTEIATQVHDSVLQTLTLIQRGADDPGEVRRLARAEERRLRSWLYTPEETADATVASAIRRAAARIEDEYGATVEVIVVGDAPLSPGSEALVGAGAEAMVNAAKHAGDDAAISVYCEVSDSAAELFVRDRGRGFDPGSVSPDRHGIRDSIQGRLSRTGGTAQLATGDTGTEWRMEVSW